MIKSLNDLVVGMYVARTPGGRMCKILAIRKKDKKIKVYDNGFWTGWVSEKTLKKEWRIPGPNA